MNDDVVSDMYHHPLFRFTYESKFQNDFHARISISSSSSACLHLVTSMLAQCHDCLGQSFLITTDCVVIHSCVLSSIIQMSPGSYKFMLS